MDAAQLLKKPANPRIPKFGAGDTVRVNFRIREGERERIQVFQGVVIRLQNGKGPAADAAIFANWAIPWMLPKLLRP